MPAEVVFLPPACNEILDDLDVAFGVPQLFERVLVHVAQFKVPVGVLTAVTHFTVVPDDHANEGAMAGCIGERKVGDGHARIRGHQGPGDSHAVGRSGPRQANGAELEVGTGQSVLPVPLSILQLLVRLIIVQPHDYVLIKVLNLLAQRIVALQHVTICMQVGLHAPLPRLPGEHGVALVEQGLGVEVKSYKLAKSQRLGLVQEIENLLRGHPI